MLRPYPFLAARIKKLFESFVSERFDHKRIVTLWVAFVKGREVPLNRVPLPKVSREWEACTAVIDIGYVGPRGSVPKGTTANGFDLVVHPLHRPVGDPGPSPGQHPVEVPGELLQRLKPAMAGAREPLAQIVLRPGGHTADGVDGI